MKRERDIFERRTFWPRPGRREVQAEFDFDRPCENCGYNLRGLRLDAPCPECGSLRGLILADDPFPWEQQRSVISFIHTIIRIILHPHECARHLWAPIRLDLPSARSFRRWSLALAAPVLCGVAWAITARTLGPSAANLALVLHAAAIILWLSAVTLHPIAFYSDKASGILLKRVQTLAHYATAPLVPAAIVQLALLPVTLETIASDESGWLLAAAVHLASLLAMLALALPYGAWLMYETVNVSATGAFAFTVAAATTALGSAAMLLIGFPVMIAAMMSRIAS